MVVIDVSLSSLFFFMLGFFAAVAMVVLLAIVWVLFPKLSEAKRFFDFWRKLNEKESKKI
ncbi:MAG: hypothetical protein J4451_01855 [DPANN group archaeon]|nr:hypothetical protein [DPANN group archaeon]